MTELIDNWPQINPLHAASIIQQVREALTGRQPNQVRTLIKLLRATALFLGLQRNFWCVATILSEAAEELF